MAPPPLYLVPLALGSLSYASYFKTGEHHLHILNYLSIFASVVLSSIALLTLRHQYSIPTSTCYVAQAALSFLGGLYATRSADRYFFHALNKFPGPRAARLTSFYFSWRLREKDCFRQMKALHDTYGAFVRIGPNNLSVAHPKAVQAIYGAGSKCTKAPWYDLTRPMVSLQTFRVRKMHDERRKVWSHAFGDRALRGYERRLRVYRQKLVEHIESCAGGPVNVTQWFNRYSFDFMGDLAFGRSFDMLENGEHWAIKLLTEGLEPLAFAFPVWFFRTLTAVPGLARDWWRFIDFCAKSMERRLENPVEVPDIMSALTASLKDGEEPDEKELELLRGDAQLIIVAGSDTTATTLTAAMFELAQHPEQVEKLRKELEPYVEEGGDGEVLNEQIASLDHMNGVIHETLRMHPPVPSMLQRKTPPEGISVDGEYIPGDITVSCPQYVMGKSAAAYVRPDEFIPERWYEKPELIREKTAWAPFSTGPYGCIGRPLAMLNVRTTIARLVMQYDIEFAEGEKGESFEGQAQEKFTIGFGELNIAFKKRVNV